MRFAARAARTRFSSASASCSAGSTPSIRLPYSALSAPQPSDSARPAATSMLARNRSDSSPGTDRAPRSGPGSCPA